MKTNFLSSSKFQVSVDKKQLLKDIVSSGNTEMNRIIKDYIDVKVNSLQENMIKDFESHPVTMEIRDGPNASNSSGLLGGYGNLFSFIGFSSSDSPIEIISNILNKKIKTTVKKRDNNGKYSVTLIIPNKEEIFNASPIPWESGRSWIDGIEKGLSGLGQYLYSDSGFNDSRSDTGIQSKSKKSGVKFRNTSYLSKIISDFKNKINRI